MVGRKGDVVSEDSELAQTYEVLVNPERKGVKVTDGQERSARGILGFVFCIT